MVGLFIVIAGLVIYYREQTHLLSSGGANWSTGVIWILIAAVSWAAYSISAENSGSEISAHAAEPGHFRIACAALSCRL